MRVQIIIQGLVQGVGYRFFAIDLARQYNVRGYVRNLPDGCVEVIAEGDKGILNDFINRLKIGSASAHVTGINVDWSDEEYGFDNFDIRF